MQLTFCLGSIPNAFKTRQLKAFNLHIKSKSLSCAIAMACGHFFKTLHILSHKFLKILRSYYGIPLSSPALLLASVDRLKSSLLKLYGRHHELVDPYGISVSKLVMDLFYLLVFFLNLSYLFGRCTMISRMGILHWTL